MVAEAHAGGIIIVTEDMPYVSVAGPTSASAIVGHDDQPFVAVEAGDGERASARRTVSDEDGVRIASASARADTDGDRRAATTAIVVDDELVAIGRTSARADADGDRRAATSSILVDGDDVVIARTKARSDADGDGDAHVRADSIVTGTIGF